MNCRPFGIEKKLYPEAIDHSQHHRDFVIGGEFLTVLCGGEAFAGEMLTHLFAPGDEEFVGRVAEVGGGYGDGEPVPQLFGMRELFFNQVAQDPFPGDLGFHDAAGEFLVVGVPLGEGSQEQIVLAESLSVVVEGEGVLQGAGNGNPQSQDSFRCDVCNRKGGGP